MDRTIAIVQARMGSTRFPGKMMAPLAQWPLLQWVLHRVGRARGLDGLVLATSRRPENDVLEQFATGMNVPVYRGDENDVLGRFCEAASVMRADVLVRICADNPFVAPEEIERVVECFKADRPDYAFNHIPRLGNNYADGFGAEVVRLSTLEEIRRRTVTPRHREHVTGYIWEHSEQFRIATLPAPPQLAFPDLAFDIDEPGDLVALEPQAATLGLDGSAADYVRVRRERWLCGA